MYIRQNWGKIPAQSCFGLAGNPQLKTRNYIQCDTLQWAWAGLLAPAVGPLLLDRSSTSSAVPGHCAIRLGRPDTNTMETTHAWGRYSVLRNRPQRIPGPGNGREGPAQRPPQEPKGLQEQSL